MAQRTVNTVLGAVQRKTGASITTIMDALRRQHRMLYAQYSWPWTYQDATLPVRGSYTTGTISITDGTANLVGTDTVWSTLWKYKRINIGSNVTYKVATFMTPTTATLTQVINTGQDWTDQNYTIFQDTYALPADCEPGDIICIVNPQVRYRLQHWPRLTAESRSVAIGVMFNNFQDVWTDAGYDEVANCYLIQFSPSCGSTTEYKIIYRRRMPDITDATSTSAIPETFDLLLEHMTEWEVRRLQGDQGWQAAKQEAYQILKGMRKRIATSLDDTYAVYSTWPTLGQSSFFDASTGLMLAGPTQPT
jgi:hypothetical protein